MKQSLHSINQFKLLSVKNGLMQKRKTVKKVPNLNINARKLFLFLSLNLKVIVFYYQLFVSVWLLCA